MRIKSDHNSHSLDRSADKSRHPTLSLLSILSLTNNKHSTFPPSVNHAASFFFLRQVVSLCKNSISSTPFSTNNEPAPPKDQLAVLSNERPLPLASSPFSFIKTFPPELFYHFAEHSLPSDLATLCLVSSSIRAVASPQLYKSMIVTSATQLRPFVPQQVRHHLCTR
jgi:hypothetical protein